MNFDEEIVRLLRVQIALQAKNAVKEFDKQKQQIIFLKMAGMKPAEIATVLGTSPNTVSVELSKARKAGELSE